MRIYSCSYISVEPLWSKGRFSKRIAYSSRLNASIIRPDVVGSRAIVNSGVSPRKRAHEMKNDRYHIEITIPYLSVTCEEIPLFSRNTHCTKIENTDSAISSGKTPLFSSSMSPTAYKEDFCLQDRRGSLEQPLREISYFDFTSHR